jgi:DNA polymerase III alpha subunit
MNHFLSDLPALDIMVKEMKGFSPPEFREVNGHIHTPYSFSAFTGMDDIFNMAKNENISVLGINDFYVTDGYDSFHKGCVNNRIFQY